MPWYTAKRTNCIPFNTGEWTDLNSVFAGADRVVGSTDNASAATAYMHLWLSFDTLSTVTFRGAPRGTGSVSNPNMGYRASAQYPEVFPSDLPDRLTKDGVPPELAARLTGSYFVRLTVSAPDDGYGASYLFSFDPPPVYAIGKAVVNDYDSRQARATVCNIGAPAAPSATPAPTPTPVPTPTATPTPTPTATPPSAEIVAGTLAVESRTVAPHGTVRVPVRFVDASDIASMNLSLTYDAQVLEVMKVERGSLLPGALFQPNTRESGIIRFGLAATTGRSGTGTLAYITFKALADEGTTPLTLSDVFVTDAQGRAVSPGLRHGTVTIEEKALKGDWNGDGKITELDALAALKMSVRLLDEDLTMDVDDDGRITASDARQILQIAVRTGSGR